MPKCDSCKNWKPDKQFRLTKLDFFCQVTLSKICFDCEKKVNSKRCGKCNGDVTLEFCLNDLKVYFCNKCRSNLYLLKDQIEAAKCEKMLKYLIKKINKMPNTIGSLRDTLFDTIERLKDGTMQIDTAKQISETAKIIIDSCRVENEFMEIAGGKGSGFIPLLDNDKNIQP